MEDGQGPQSLRERQHVEAGVDEDTRCQIHMPNHEPVILLFVATSRPATGGEIVSR